MDQYDQDIAKILRGKSVYAMWNEYAPLFQVCAETGCLTQVRNLTYGGEPSVYGLDEKIFNEITEDRDIHYDSMDLESDIDEAETYEDVVNILYPYATWQRRLDQLYPIPRCVI